MRHSDVVLRLAAANPVPVDRATPARVRWSRARIALVAVALAVTVPAAAFAGRLGDLLGISNEGTPVPAGSLSFTMDSKLEQAMRDLGFPATLQLLGEREGLRFYASRRADGSFCFAVDSATPRQDGVWQGKAVGCAPAGLFPSALRPILDFSPVSAKAVGGTRYVTDIAGFAADAVAEVDLVDVDGTTIATALVRDNLYAATNLPHVEPGGIVARDHEGAVIYRGTIRVGGREG